jgi:hypothetical protein
MLREILLTRLWANPEVTLRHKTAAILEIQKSTQEYFATSISKSKNRASLRCADLLVDDSCKFSWRSDEKCRRSSKKNQGVNEEEQQKQEHDKEQRILSDPKNIKLVCWTLNL